MTRPLGTPLRASLLDGRMPAIGDLAGLVEVIPEVKFAFALPWPWGGELFELRRLQPLTYITGPLGSGKTRFARALADNLPDANFLGLDRLAAEHRPDVDAGLQEKVDEALVWLVDEGAVAGAALTALLAGLERNRSRPLVVDMVEEGLDQPTQQALMAYLRRRRAGAGPLFLMTRSNAILDLGLVGAGETIILCPANHNSPMLVAPFPGAPGYEAVATCLASPEIRARTQGVIAWRPQRG